MVHVQYLGRNIYFNNNFKCLNISYDRRLLAFDYVISIILEIAYKDRYIHIDYFE